MVTSKALSLFDNFNQLTPYAVGYDRVFDQLQKYVQNNVQSSGFPPYNIQKGGDYNYTIEIALAGFSKDDIEVEVAENTLSVRSDKKAEPEDEFTYHRGISIAGLIVNLHWLTTLLSLVQIWRMDCSVLNWRELFQKKRNLDLLR